MPETSDPTTPMMRQYQRIKQAHRDAVLFFRLGDFYEMFKSDAEEVSRLLGLTLTQRNGVPMCGIPYHASHTYVSRLLKAGKKIAICEQVKMPENGKGIAERDVVEIITPGTVTEEDYLEAGKNNYLVAIGAAGEEISLSYVDISTGELLATSFSREFASDALRRELARIRPREVLVQESLLEEEQAVAAAVREAEDIVVNRFPDWSFDLEASRDRLLSLLGVANLKGFGIAEEDPALYSIGVLLEYVEDTAKSVLPHIRDIRVHRENAFLVLDESTQRNLEIVANMQDGSRRYTLLSILEHTRTAMGSRLLRRWLLAPLLEIEEIAARQERVAALYHNQMLLGAVRETLGRILDVERLTARVAMDRAHAKDLVALRTSLQYAFEVERQLPDWFDGERTVCGSREQHEAAAALVTLLGRALLDAPSVLLTEGNMIRLGYSAELDELTDLKKNSRQVLDGYLEEEKARTGISTLRIRYNKIIGHFFEVTKSHLDKVPSHFIRRQSLVNAERYTTEKLSELEARLSSASEQIVDLEKSLFLQLREEVKRHVAALLETSKALSRVDVLQSFAWAATRYGYGRPTVTRSGGISIELGRHPVVEAHLPSGSFVPNGLTVEQSGKRFALITGPNMAGKSTFLRQTALIVLMAQVGSFVPAQSAEIGIVDRIFCRVGASDNLARGESTFLVEMNETSNILRNSSEQSLIIMDEVGRGTGTNDGLAIAWAVSEHLLNATRARTLFATHYHELTGIEHPALFNLSMSVAEDRGGIVFLKKVRSGPSNNSYGIHVARLAGLPDTVLQRAGEILQQIEAGSAGGFQGQTEQEVRTAAPQGGLFSESEMVEKEILSLDVAATAPLEALNRIARWQAALAGNRTQTQNRRPTGLKKRSGD